MMTKCDHCRGALGSNVHLYWRMRYCSFECALAYQSRLEVETTDKIHCLELRPHKGSSRKEAA
jgi:hypothetical protein